MNVYTDGGHSWGKVRIEALVALGIAHKITPYSYRNHTGYAFLEEDCDIATYFNAFNAKHGRDPKQTLRHTDRRSRIRDYPSFYLHEDEHKRSMKNEK